MKKRTIYTKEVRNGDCGMDLPIYNAIKTFEGVRVKITIEEFKKPVSDKIKAYYFTVCIPVIQQLMHEFDLEGREFTKEQAHEFVKIYVWDWTMTIELLGVATKIPLSMTRIPQKDWKEMLQNLQKFASERGKFIPDPQEQIPDYILEMPDWDYKL